MTGWYSCSLCERTFRDVPAHKAERRHVRRESVALLWAVVARGMWLAILMYVADAALSRI